MKLKIYIENRAYKDLGYIIFSVDGNKKFIIANNENGKLLSTLFDKKPNKTKVIAKNNSNDL